MTGEPVVSTSAPGASAPASTEPVLRALADACPDPILARGSDGRLTYVNPVAVDVLGLPATELLGRTQAEYSPLSPIARLLAETDPGSLAAPKTIEVRGRDPRRGEERIWQCTMVPLPAAGTPEAAGFACVSHDITEATRSELSVADSEARFRNTFEQAAIGIAHVALDGTWLRTNRRLREMLGYSEPELLERRFQDLTYRDDLEADLEYVRRLLAGKIDTFSMEKRYIRKDGTLIWGNLTVSLVRDRSGAPQHFISMVEDITGRKAAEATLRAFYESSPFLMGIYALLEDGDLLRMYHNPAAMRFFRVPPDRAPMIRAREIGVPEKTIGFVRRRMQEMLLRGAPLSGDFNLPTEGGVRKLAVTAAHLGPLGPSGEPAFCYIAEDVTERRAAEAELQRLNHDLEARVREEVAAREAVQARLTQAERLTALGQLAGGIAHDFNNVLQALQGAAGLLRRRVQDPEGIARLIGLMEEATDRGMSVTQRLLTFARRGDLRAEPLDPAALLSGMVELLAHTLGTSIVVRHEAADELPMLLADKGQLETVLVNLATNARDAMPRGGTLTLAAALDTRGRQPSGPIPLGVLEPGRYVRLSMTDTGVGIPSEALSRVTEPFFTTKEPGKGTGLGLAMARAFVEHSGGAMAIESEVGRGTTVTLWLPLAEPGATASEEPGAGAGRRPQAAGRSILLVDDDALVREVIADQLETAGFSVLPARSAGAALTLLEAERIDLLLSDLSMPGTDGIALIQEAQRRIPGLPAILLTGFLNTKAELAADAMPGSFSLLRKPVKERLLIERISTLLENR